MFDAKDVTVWTNHKTHEVRLTTSGHVRRDFGTGWVDPIGAAYSSWHEASNVERVRLMLETALDLAMNGFDLGEVLRVFAQVKQFRALGGESYPMCRALTSALVGKSLEPNTMSFEELLEHYKPRRT